MIVAAVGVAEITGIVMGEETVLNSLTPVGKSQIGKVVSRPSKRSVAGVIDFYTPFHHCIKSLLLTFEMLLTQATVVDSMVETVMAEAGVLREKEDVTTTGVPALQKTGQNLFPETKESKQSSSVSTLNFLCKKIFIRRYYGHQNMLTKNFSLRKYFRCRRTRTFGN